MQLYEVTADRWPQAQSLLTEHRHRALEVGRRCNHERVGQETDAPPLLHPTLAGPVQ
jgi:hypothetical protein